MSILNPSGRAPILGDVSEFECRVTNGGWSWAEERADVIAAHWLEARAAKPDLFDGEVLIATEVGIEGPRLVSEHSVVRYSALTYWRSLGFPRAEAFNLFGCGVVVTRDGAVLLGRMAAHTANAGFTYFPCGTPDPDDVVDGRLDVEGSIVREIEEETGLAAARLTPSDQKWISWDGPLFACAQRYDLDMTAAEAETVVRAHLVAQEKPELEKVFFVRGLDEIPNMSVPVYAVALLGQVLV